MTSSKGCLLPSESVIYVDIEAWRNRIDGLSQSIFRLKDAVVKPQTIQKAMNELKTDIKPTYLSQVVTENLDTNTLGNLRKSQQGIDLEEKLASPQFVNGLIRIIRYEELQNVNSNQDNTDIVNANALKNITVFSVDTIRTHLMSAGEKLLNSDREKTHFIKRDENASTIYVVDKSLTQQSCVLATEMCQVINEIMEDRLKHNGLLFLSQILQCKIEDIGDILNQLKVPLYEAIELDDCEAIYKPKPGQYVPLEFHHLLQHAIECLCIGEYVAYEVYDPLDAGVLDQSEGAENTGENAIYRYARIQEIITKQGYYHNYRYKIDLGDDEEHEVHASSLYKFVRQPQRAKSVSADSHEIPKAEGSVLEIKEEITKTLEEAWKLEDNIKRKIIKRLQFQWHPDKNPDNIELSTEVFKYIQNEIERLIKGLSRSEYREPSRRHSGNRRYKHYYRYYSARAKAYKQYSDNFEQQYGDECDSGSRGYSGSPSGSSHHYTPPRYVC